MRQRAIKRDIDALHLGSAPDLDVVGLDGTSYVLTFGDGSVSVSHRWRERPPREWAPLEAISKRVVGLVEQASGNAG